MCDHGFIGACAECDGCEQQPDLEQTCEAYADNADRVRAFERLGFLRTDDALSGEEA
jgi:hypothetical protein